MSLVCYNLVHLILKFVFFKWIVPEVAVSVSMTPNPVQCTENKINQIDNPKYLAPDLILWHSTLRPFASAGVLPKEDFFASTQLSIFGLYWEGNLKDSRLILVKCLSVVFPSRVK